MARHGARAPYVGGGFPGYPEGMLTAQGMRAKYLLGRYNRHKYGYSTNQINMSSTDKYRTIQSGYAELLGLTSGSNITISAGEDLKIPFAVRRGKAEIVTFVQVPTYTQDDMKEWGNRQWFANCPYVDQIWHQRLNNPKSYRGYQWLLADLRHGYQTQLSLATARMTEAHGIKYGDAVSCQLFDLMPQKYNWTQRQLQEMRLEVFLGDLVGFTKETRRWFVSRMLRSAIAQLKGAAQNTQVKAFKIDSSDQHNIANVIVQLSPGFVIEFVPFASTFKFQLVSGAEGDLFVSTEFNGKTLPLDTCGGQAFCPYDLWQKHMEKTLKIEDMCQKEVKEVDLGLLDPIPWQFEPKIHLSNIFEESDIGVLETNILKKLGNLRKNNREKYADILGQIAMNI